MTAPVTNLVDGRLGLVRSLDPVELHPGLPRALHLVAARPSARPGRGAGAHAASPGGAAWWEPAAARAAALGEAVERYCASAAPATACRSSYARLAQAGVDAVDPASLALYSPAQYATPGFPFSGIEQEQEIDWVRGIGAGSVVLVPRSLAALTATGEGRPAHLPVNAGLAAAPNPARARIGALEELLERHCVATAWHAGSGFRPLAVPRWLADTLGPALRATVLEVPNDFALPVALVLLADRETGVLGAGTALRPRMRDAVTKAAAEAVVSCQAAHDLDDPAVMGDWAAGAPGAALKPWRADRGYRDAYRADLRDVVDVFCHVQLYLDPALHGPLRERLATGRVDHLPPLREATGRPEYLQRVRAAGLRVISIDLTGPDVAACGLSVARVLVPGLRATAPAAFPFLGGLRPAPGTRSLCALPLPHA